MSAAGSGERWCSAVALPSCPGYMPVALPALSHISCVTMTGSPFAGRNTRSIRQTVTSWISHVTVTWSDPVS